MHESHRRTIDPTRYAHIAFQLEIDEDGYPPVGVETLWARRENNELIVDNIPFFVLGVSYNDAIAVDTVDGRLMFKEVKRFGGHSTVRVIVNDLQDKQRVINDFQQLGCATEIGPYESLVAIDIPPEVKVDPIRQYLEEGCNAEIFDYEEANVTWETSYESDDEDMSIE